MITAVDTNILLDILVPNDQFYQASADALEQAAGEGSIVISDIVYPELCIHFETQRDCDAFLESNEIRVQLFTREAHFLASRACGCIGGKEESGPEFLRIFWSELTLRSRRRACFPEIAVSIESSFHR